MSGGKEIDGQRFDVARAIPIAFRATAGEGDTADRFFVIMPGYPAAFGIQRFHQLKARDRACLKNNSCKLRAHFFLVSLRFPTGSWATSCRMLIQQSKTVGEQTAEMLPNNLRVG